MLLKEKGDWGQQILQALVEFQCKALKRQQTITFIDTICLVVVMIIPRIVRMGRGGLGDHNTSPVTCEGSHLSVCGEYTEHTAVTGDTNNQGSAEQNTSETQNTHGLQTTVPQGPLHRRQPREDSSEEEKGH